MDSRHRPSAPDQTRNVAVTLYAPGDDFAAVRGGTGTATDLAPYCARIEQSPDEVSLQLSWHHELYGAGQPLPGQLVALWLDGLLLWVGIIEAINDYRAQSGTRTMTLTARSRDALPKWRNQRRVTDIYPTASYIDTIVRDVGAALGLTEDEIVLPPLTLAVPHSNLQLADQTAWEMLETLLLPAGYSPLVDGLGRLRARPRDVLGRSPDLSLTAERIVAVTSARGRSPVSAARLKWLDPNLSETVQSGRSLAGANITAGFFQVEQKQDVFWSDDRTQRARDTYLVVKQSANSGLIKVCDERYTETSHTGGAITLETASWVPGLLAIFLAIKAAGAIPDIAPPSGGPTAPVGKMAHAALELSVLLVMTSIGTGVYEVWGTPFDFVHARNITEAYDAASPDWGEAVAEFDSDLIINADHARAVAARELIYRNKSAQRYGVQIIDDPRIEPGDLIALPDGSRLYVTSYRRQLGRDAPAVLDIEGFPA
jgi:hypothetical protein